ncbi:MAG: Nif3-like dinuclear metal center hexameric protein [Thermodesulforhabdaceae bacterium]
MQVKNLISWINAVAPFEYAEPWDNVGLQVGDPEARVTKVLFALDPSTSSVDEASRLGCECLIVHHPLILEGIRSLNTFEYPQKLVVELIRRQINLIVAHTNLDASRLSINQRIAEFLELENVESLETNPKFVENQAYAGIGLSGKLRKPRSLGELSSGLCRYLGISSCQLAGNPDQIVNRIAVCSGSGGSLLKKIIAHGADCFVTGEIKYHDSVWARESGVSVIALGHFHSEKSMMKWFAEDLRIWSLNINDPVEVFWFEGEQDSMVPYFVEHS